jgi:hypothetical protein
MVFNFIVYHKYAKRKPELFEIGKEKKTFFLIYFIATLGIMVGVIIIKEVYNIKFNN